MRTARPADGRAPAIACRADFHWGPHHWPYVNTAEIAITVGTALIVINELFGRKHVREANG